MRVRRCVDKVNRLVAGLLAVKTKGQLETLDLCPCDRALRQAHVEIPYRRPLARREALEDARRHSELVRHGASLPEPKLRPAAEDEDDRPVAHTGDGDLSGEGGRQAGEHPDRRGLLLLPEHATGGKLDGARQPHAGELEKSSMTQSPDDPAARRDEPAVPPGANDRDRALRRDGNSELVGKRSVESHRHDRRKGQQPPLELRAIEPDKARAAELAGDAAYGRGDTVRRARDFDAPKSEHGGSARTQVTESESAGKSQNERDHTNRRQPVARQERLRRDQGKAGSTGHGDWFAARAAAPTGT